ncbi:hypothetical protein SAMN04488057_114104 [Cyclobacterium lianum]|uniref:Uncharacterized protein n=2 Tax=Cyclobacterium lianum TaxID=388280 RepID=A0A1M7Q6T0_9BACT|nr:hypothetical protein SAMN04488057_114104 [Cyclobacterium lianum]
MTIGSHIKVWAKFTICVQMMSELSIGLRWGWACLSFVSLLLAGCEKEDMDPEFPAEVVPTSPGVEAELLSMGILQVTMPSLTFEALMPAVLT